MDAIPGPRRPRFHHIVVPFLPNTKTLSDLLQWESSLPENAQSAGGFPSKKGQESFMSTVINTLIRSQLNKTTQGSSTKSPSGSSATNSSGSSFPEEEIHEEIASSAESTEMDQPVPRIIKINGTSLPIDRWNPDYWDIQIQEHLEYDAEDPPFVQQSGVRPRAEHKSEVLLQDLKELGISTEEYDAASTRECPPLSTLQFLSEKARRNKPSFLTMRRKPIIPLTSQTYDGLGFRYFPDRMGYDVAGLDCEWDLDSFLAFFHQRPEVDMAVFLQAWLFFGFLSEVFGYTVREQDYITTITKSGGIFAVLTLQRLITTNQWNSWELMIQELFDLHVMTGQHLDAYITRVKHCLDLASKFTRLEDSGRFFPVSKQGQLAGPEVRDDIC